MKRVLLIVLIFCSCHTGDSNHQPVPATTSSPDPNGHEIVKTDLPADALKDSSTCSSKAVVTKSNAGDTKASPDPVAEKPSECTGKPVILPQDSVNLKKVKEDVGGGSDMEGFIPFIRQY